MSAKPKVTFIRGPIVASTGSINNEATPSIAFAYLSGYLRKHGYETFFVDAIGEGLNRIWPLDRFEGFSCQGLTFEQIEERIPADSDVLAFSTMFSGEWPVLRDLIQKLRPKFPDALIVAGGEHVTALPEFSLRDCPEIDVIVRGEGEHILYEALEAWKSGGYDLVGGISFLNSKGEYVENGQLPRIRDLESIPWPHWPDGYLEKFWEQGKSYGVGSERDMPFMSSRGCPYQCTFCSNPAMWTTRYILRDTDDCVAEIQSYIKKWDVTSLQFYDLTAITKKTWILEFCDKLKKAGVRLPWSLPSGTRSEVLDEETLDAIAETGCRYLVYAPESGSPETLKRVKKQVSLPKLETSVKAAIKRGITCRTNLIIGFPGETRKNMFETLIWGLKMSALGVDEVPVFLYNPYPGSEIFREAVKHQNVKLDDDYFMTLTSLNGKYVSSQSVSLNEFMGPNELVFWRTLFMGANFLISYLFYPKRIVRTIRNLFSGKESATVLEHRLQDAFNRRWGKGSAEKAKEEVRS